VPPTNPFYVNPAGGQDPVEVLYDFGNVLGPLTTSVNVRSANTALTVNADVGAWSLTGSLEYATERLRQFTGDAVNDNALALRLANPDPATAFNPFTSGAATTRELAQELRTTLLYASRSDVQTVELTAKRALLQLPSGGIEFDWGAQYRKERLMTAISGPLPGSDLGRSVAATHAQLRIPFIGEGNRTLWARRLDVSFGERFEKYVGLASVWAPKFGFTWSPIEQAVIRGTWGRAYRMPAKADIDERPNQSYIGVLPGAGSTTGTSTLIWAGGNANLQAERSTTRTFGVDLAPTQGLLIGLTYFDVVDRGRLNQLFLALNALSDPTVLDRVTWQPTTAQRQEVCGHSTFFGSPADCLAAPIGAILDLRTRNEQELQTRGFDASARFQIETNAGQFDIRLNATYLLAFSQTFAPGTSPIELLNTAHNPINLRARGEFSWRRGLFSASTFVNFTNGYRDVASTPIRSVRSWTTFDWAFESRLPGEGFSWLPGTTVVVNIQNLFNRRAPFLNNAAAAIGYDQENSYLDGRVVGVQVRYRW
jgi:iron complex outermembrane receptor protein